MYTKVKVTSVIFHLIYNYKSYIHFTVSTSNKYDSMIHSTGDVLLS